MDARLKKNKTRCEITSLTLEESNQLLLVQKEILETTLMGSDYQQTLNKLCETAEGLANNSIASIMLLNEQQDSLNIRSAPNLNKGAVGMLNGLTPGEFAGSCGTAVYKQIPQFSINTLIDERWADFQSYIKEHGVLACWSVPIFNRHKQVIGAFALSSFEERAPTEFHKSILLTASRLVSLILQREKDDNALFHSAHHDALTHLANRTLFNIRFEHAIARVNRNQTTLAVLFMDMNGFKAINDQFGHDVGDKVLIQAANRLSSCIRREDTLARFGGDEFVLLVEDSELELKNIAEKIIEVFKKKIEIEEGDFLVEFSIGISEYPKNGLTQKEIIRAADKAMYVAKKDKNIYFHFYEE